MYIAAEQEYHQPRRRRRGGGQGRSSCVTMASARPRTCPPPLQRCTALPRQSWRCVHRHAHPAAGARGQQPVMMGRTGGAVGGASSQQEGQRASKAPCSLTNERHRPTPQNGRHGAPPPAGGMPMPRLKPHRVPYDVRGGRWAMPLEAWQPVRTVVAGCVRVRWVRRSRTQSSDRDFLRMAIGSAG